MEVLPYEIYSNKNRLAKKGIEIHPKVSLLVAIYNNTHFFDIVFASVESQTYKDFELVICDDGSKPENAEHVKKAMAKSNILVKYIWHTDKGFKKNEILNKGLVNAETDYIIFIDQDCVLHPEFMREHAEHRKEKTILSGRSMEFSPMITKMLTPQNVRKGFIQKNMWWFLPILALRKDNQGDKGVYIRNKTIRKLRNRKPRGVVGRNFSVAKTDLFNINGFDMRYVGVGIGEDSDIEYRLNLSGVETTPFCNAAVQYHLWHPYLPRKNNNDQLFEEIQKQKLKVTPFGTNLIQPLKAKDL